LDLDGYGWWEIMEADLQTLNPQQHQQNRENIQQHYANEIPGHIHDPSGKKFVLQLYHSSY